MGSLGLVYQDSVNQAALLLYKDSNDKQYLMVSTNFGFTWVGLVLDRALLAF